METEQETRTYEVKVVVEHYFTVEAKDEAEAEELAWKYEEHITDAQVYSIEVEEQDTEQDEDEDEDTENV